MSVNNKYSRLLEFRLRCSGLHLVRLPLQHARSKKFAVHSHANRAAEILRIMIQMKNDFAQLWNGVLLRKRALAAPNVPTVAA